MVKQLEDREIQLKEKTNALSQSMNLLVSIMDTQSQWIIVMDCEIKKLFIQINQLKNTFII